MLNTELASPESRVAAIAYALWLEEGQPQGRAEAHWFKALDLVNTEEVPAAKRPPAAAAAKKAAPRKRS